ncbi:MAG: hypothetical protein Q9182_006305 [Xanthomendoza sp. 2 TL-2023]
MEGLAALGLACNVVQLVDFSLTIARDFHHIYKTGHMIKQQDFASKTENLSAISENLKEAIAGHQTPQPLTKTDTELYDIAMECQKLAINLQEELRNIFQDPSSSHKLTKAFMKTVRFQWHASEIGNIMQKMSGHQKLLENRVLVALFENSKSIFFDQQERFEGLQSELQYFISRLANGFTSLAELTKHEADDTRRHVTSEHDATREHVTNMMHSLEIPTEHPMLESLKFQEMYFRQQHIDEAFEDTFAFIFDASGEELGPWSNFVEWLRPEEEAKLYWINGKTGSGKSTLMKFICGDSRLKMHLSQSKHHAASMPLVLTFFFWYAGNVMQKTVYGLLQSLLHQIFSHDKSILQAVLLSHASPPDLSLNYVWSLRQLKELLKAALTVSSRRFYFFIDGLDEFDEDYWELLDIIDSLKQLCNVKICVSSRPRQEFTESFKDQPGLKLEDLTRGSISKYVKHLLIDDPRVKRLVAREPHKSEDLVKVILRRARGVFLWVKLVVKHLRQGLVNKDDWETLMQRLEDCPEEVEKIFEHKWARYQGDLKHYKKKAEYYFRLVLYKEMSLLDFSICVNEELQKVLEESTPRMNESEVASICEQTRDYITVYSSGLLEVVDHPRNASEVYEDILEWRDIEDLPATGDERQTVYVRFTHRTARDFVSETLDFPIARRNTHLGSKLDIIQAYIKSRFVLLVLDPKAAESLQLINEVPKILDRMPRDELSMAAVRFGEIVRECLISLEQVYAKIMENEEPRDVRSWHHKNSIVCEVLGAAIIQGSGEHIAPLLADSFRAKPTYLAYLLGCATSWDLRSSDVPLIRTLLQAGASPMGDPASFTLNMDYNGRYLPTAPWYILLTNLWSTEWLSDTEYDGAAELTIEFLAYGADLAQYIPLVFSVPTEQTSRSHSLWRRYEDSARFSSVHDKHIIVMTNPASILRRILREEFWSDILEDYPDLGILSIEDRFEVVMLYDDDADGGPWRRVSCTEDAGYLLNQRSRISLESTSSRDGEEDPVRGRYPPWAATLVRKLAGVWHRSISFGGYGPDSVNITGWSPRMTTQMVRLLKENPLQEDDEIIQHFKIPDELFVDHDLVETASRP